ncbi:GNAT family N-acetyltransferase [Deinococcus sp.]|uniref:GNAT family N-acetyltransferase n=1 Tax=Deinococcus sp. TaxID=47478 RepID=UPI003CC59D9D
MSLSRDRHLTPEIRALLTLAMSPHRERVRAALDAYASDAGLQVWSWEVAGQRMCAAGMRVQGAQAELLHLGTRLDARHSGYGRALLLALMTDLHLERLEAETDDEAIGFYRRAGFEVEETATRFGTPRYRCLLRGATV